MITQQQKSKFEKDGYIILNWMISNDFIDHLLDDLNGKYRYDSPHYNLNNRIENAFLFSKYVKELAINDKILDSLKILCGGNYFPFQTLNFEKGTEQRLHSDWFHFAPSNNYGLAGVWVALEDTDENNGALTVVPGSHKLPNKFPSDLGIKVGSRKTPYEYYSEYEDAIDKIVEDSKLQKKIVPIEKGQILIWHSNLIHGGSKILNLNSTRYSQVTHYFQKDKLYFSPIKSGKNYLRRNYRLPLNILTGRREIPFIS